MSLRYFLYLLLALWLAAYAGSFLQFMFTEASGDGFTRGMNRVMAFLGWQLVAAMLGGMIWLVAARLPHRPLVRWLMRLPAVLGLLLLLAIGALILYARIGNPAPVDAPTPKPATTAPVAVDP